MQQNLCKTCGGDLDRVGNHYVCRACGNKWSVDAADDVHVVDRANAWAALRDGDFDHAAELFEIIHEKEPKDHEAFWGLALACAGVLYVVDYVEHKKVPTCHNIDDGAFLGSKNVKKAMELAPPEIAASYRRQAEQIEQIRQEWQQKARKEKPYDIFLSYKDSDRENGIERTQDSVDAQDLYNMLVHEGYRVFFSRISLHDKISEHYEPYIYNAIKTAKVMIVFGEKPEYFNATWVRNEWTRFKRRIDNGEKHEKSLVVVTKRMNPGDLPFALKSRQCINADEMSFGTTLLRHVETIVKESKGSGHLTRTEVVSGQIGRKASSITQNTITKRELGQGAASSSISEKQSLVLVETYIKEKQWEDAETLLESMLFENPDCAEAIWCQLLVSHKVASNTVLMRILDRFKPEDYVLVEKALGCGSKEFAGRILDLFYQSAKILPNQVREKVYNMILPYRYERREQQLKENFEWSISNHDFKFFKLLLTALEQNDVDQYIDYNARYIKATMDHEEKRECTDNILAVDEGNRVARMYLFEAELTTSAKIETVVKTFEDVLKYSENIDADVEDALVLTTAVLSTPLHCDFAKQLPTYYRGDLKTIRRSLMALGNRMILKSFFDAAVEVFGLLISLNESDVDAFWGVCLAKTHSKSEEQIVDSPILLKKQSEYNKYLTLVDNERRVKCVRLAQKQQNVQKSRRRKRIRIVVGASVAGLLVAGAVVTFTVILPSQQLKKADQLFAVGDYAAAGELYQQLGGYNDSAKRAETVKAILQVQANNHGQAVSALLAQGIPVEITYKAEGGLVGGDVALALGHTLSADGSIIPLNSDSAGDGKTETTRRYNKSEEFTGLVTPDKKGYQFVGWVTDTFSYDASGADPVFHLVVKATWEIRTFAINFDLNGGTLLGETPDKYTVEDAEIKIPAAQKDGFTFLGWIWGDNTTPSKEATIPAQSAGDVTFKAVWEGLSYEITFDYAAPETPDGLPEKLEIVCGEPLTLPVPERVGYRFDGWWDGTVKVQDGVWNRPESVTFTAKWHVEEYTLKYHTEGGRNDASNPAHYTVETETFKLADPVREGYVFLGWGTSKDDANPVKGLEIQKGSTGNREFYALWKEKESTLTLDAGGGTCAVTKLTVVYGGRLELPSPTRAGYTFLGWFLKDTLVANGSICRIAEDSVLTAKWEADFYSIDYKLNGGRNHADNPTYFTVEMEVVLQEPTKTGHTFLGWTWAGQTTPQKTVTIAKGTATNLTYEAKWQANRSTVTLNPAGGVCGVSEMTVTYGQNLTLPVPTREGYDFLGWYLGDQQVVDGPCPLEQDGELTAKWEAVRYTITYNGLEDGINPSQNLTVYTCESEFTLRDPIRTGYDFLGWTHDGQTTPVKDVSISLGEQGNKAFTAHWKIKTTRVTLATEGGTEDGREITNTYNSAYNFPIPTRVGYTFDGWLVDGEPIEQSGTWTRTETTLTVTAKWNVNTYTVTLEDLYEYSGERTLILNDNYPEGQINTVSYNSGETLQYVTPAARSGFIFVGWYTAEGELFDFTAPLETDVELFAQWAATHGDCIGTIPLNGVADGLTSGLYAFVSPVTQQVEIHTGHDGGDPVFKLFDENYVGLDDTTYDDEYGNQDAWASLTIEAGKVYYVELGNYDSSGVLALYLNTVDVMDGGLVVGDAQDGYWYREGYTVSFEVQYGAALDLPTPSRDGYTFVGWTVVAGGVTESLGNTWLLDSDGTLRAQWQ